MNILFEIKKTSKLKSEGKIVTKSLNKVYVTICTKRLDFPYLLITSNQGTGEIIECCKLHALIDQH